MQNDTALDEWAWQEGGIGTTARLVLVYLVHISNADEVAIATYEDIAEGTHLKPKTVGRALRELRETGLIAAQRRMQTDRRGRAANAYQLRP